MGGHYYLQDTAQPALGYPRCVPCCLAAVSLCPCSVSPGELPSLQQLGFDAATLQRCANDKSAAGARLRGGESEAMRRLTDFITHFTHPGSASSSTASASSSSSGKKNGVAAEAPNFCCKISPWLALGCLSPRQLYEQLQQKLAGRQQQIRAAGQGSDTGKERLCLEQWYVCKVRLCAQDNMRSMQQNRDPLSR